MISSQRRIETLLGHLSVYSDVDMIKVKNTQFWELMVSFS